MAETYNDALSRETESDGYVVLGSTASLDRTTLASRAAAETGKLDEHETSRLDETGDLGTRRRVADGRGPLPAQGGEEFDDGELDDPFGPDMPEADSVAIGAQEDSEREQGQEAELGETQLVGAGETLLRPRSADDADGSGDLDDDDFDGDPFGDDEPGETDLSAEGQTVRSPLPVMGGDERLEQLGESFGYEDNSEEAFQAMQALEERRASRRKAKFVRVGIAAAAIAAVIGGYFIFTALTAPKVELASYQTATVERTDFTISVQGTGMLRPASQVLVTPEVDGIINSVNVSEGQFVHEGDVLFTVRSAEIEKAIFEAQESLDRAQRDVDRAYEELGKAEATKNTARQNHDTAQGAYDQAIAAAQAAYDRAYADSFNRSRQDTADEIAKLGQEIAKHQSELQPRQAELARLDEARSAWEAAKEAWEGASDADKPALEKAMSKARTAYDALGGDVRTEELWAENSSLQTMIDDKLNLKKSMEDAAVAAGNAAGEAAKAQVVIPEVPYYDEASYNAAIDAARSSIDAAETARDTAQRTLDQEKEKGEKRTVTAPKNGTLISLGASVGGSVGAATSSSNGGSLATIADITQMHVSLEINEVDISKVAAGQRAMVTFSSIPGLEATARVVDVASTASGSGDGGAGGGGVAAFTVDCVISKPDSRLKPGMTATVTIYTTDIPNALVVPSSAILDLTGGPFVDVVIDPEAPVEEGGVPATDRRKVSTGESNATDTVVETGVAEGDEVLIGGAASMGGLDGLAEGDLSSLESLSAEELGLTEEELAELEALTAE